MLRPYTFDGSRVSTVVVAVMHMFCIGMYIVLVSGLYAPAGQFLPPLLPGQIDLLFVDLREQRFAVDDDLARLPSIVLMTFCATVGRAQRNSPVCPIERVDDAGLAGNAGDRPCAARPASPSG